MKEHLHTIPVNEAFLSGDECPFCYLQRQTEQRIIRYTAGPGASYMEPEVRGVTDKTGFCPAHLKKLYDYGNTLGNALMLQTYYARVQELLHAEIEDFEVPGARKLFGKQPAADTRLREFLTAETESCYICTRLEENMSRYYSTFFALLKEAEFRSRVENCKGFCLRHFPMMLRQASEKLPNSQHEWFYSTVFSVMEENLNRVKDDLDWFIEKFDYRNAGADWKNSKDAVSRSMQKLRGIYPADPPYKEK